MNWDITKSSFPQADRCLAARPELTSLATEITRCCYNILPSAWRCISKTSSRDRMDNYFFRFVLPVAELAGWPSKPPKDLPLVLSAQLLWCFAWRALDDVLDSPKPTPEHIGRSFATFSDALAMTLQCAPAKPAVFIGQLTKMYALSCDVAAAERAEGLRVSECWRRASPFFIVPALVLRLEKSRIEQYRRYVNAAALTHDIHDLLSDIQAGINSPPVRWLRETDSDFPFRPQIVRAWFHRAAGELEKQLTRCRGHANVECLVLTIMIEEAQVILNELRDGL